MYTYDNDGNTTSKTDSTGTTSYAWDYENRLSSVTLPNSGGTVSFKYDPFGRRIEKISPTTTSIFAYDSNNLIETVNSSGGVVARYAQAPGIDQPLAMQRGSTTSFYEADGLGSITSLSNAAGALAQTYTYDSFGNQTASSGSLTNFLRYTAREFDTETDLYYYRARYYEPFTGRFLTEDPTQFLAGTNLYEYVRNSPVRLLDPYGLFSWCFSCTLDQFHIDAHNPLEQGQTLPHLWCDLLHGFGCQPSTSAGAVDANIATLGHIFPGSVETPDKSLIIPMNCFEVAKTLAAQGYQFANSWGYGGLGSAFDNPLPAPWGHLGGMEWRTFGPGFHFRMQYPWWP
jgi:RHS repeat-associated protein